MCMSSGSTFSHHEVKGVRFKVCFLVLPEGGGGRERGGGAEI